MARITLLTVAIFVLAITAVSAVTTSATTQARGSLFKRSAQGKNFLGREEGSSAVDDLKHAANLQVSQVVKPVKDPAASPAIQDRRQARRDRRGIPAIVGVHDLPEGASEAPRRSRRGGAAQEMLRRGRQANPGDRERSRDTKMVAANAAANNNQAKQDKARITIKRAVQRSKEAQASSCKEVERLLAKIKREEVPEFGQDYQSLRPFVDHSEDLQNLCHRRDTASRKFVDDYIATANNGMQWIICKKTLGALQERVSPFQAEIVSAITTIALAMFDQVTSKEGGVEKEAVKKIAGGAQRLHLWLQSAEPPLSKAYTYAVNDAVAVSFPAVLPQSSSAGVSEREIEMRKLESDIIVAQSESHANNPVDALLAKHTTTMHTVITQIVNAFRVFASDDGFGLAILPLSNTEMGKFVAAMEAEANKSISKRTLRAPIVQKAIAKHFGKQTPLVQKITTATAMQILTRADSTLKDEVNKECQMFMNEEDKVTLQKVVKELGDFIKDQNVQHGRSQFYQRS